MLALFFAVAFIISWGGILLVVGGSSGFTGTSARDDPRFTLVYLAMLAGPVVSGLLFTWIVGGRVGLRSLVSRITRWRVSPREYLIALLTAPLIVTTVGFALSFASSRYEPSLVTSMDGLSVLVFGVAVGLGAGVCEELGWTGFAVPQLRRRYGTLTSGLILGVLWAAWHVLAVVWGLGNTAGSVPVAVFLPMDLLAILPAYRILMVWNHDRTQSLFVSMLMHASLTATLLVLSPADITGASLLVFDLVVGAAMWGIVVVVGRGHAAFGRRGEDRHARTA